jgi:hypothetical protein
MRKSLDAARADWRARFENRAPVARGAIKTRVSASAPDTTEVLIYDEIGFWGVTAKDFAAALGAISTPNILLRINSPGGDVFDGLAMHAAIKGHSSNIVARIEGLAASAGLHERRGRAARARRHRVRHRSRRGQRLRSGVLGGQPQGGVVTRGRTDDLGPGGPVVGQPEQHRVRGHQGCVVAAVRLGL